MNRNQIRIIGGKYRSRNIFFPDVETLRPTPDRVRETLFNWLSPYIVDARCLDVFAGSGAFSFEALSRGARFCLCIDQEPLIIDALHKNQAALKISPDHLKIILSDSLVWLKGNGTPFDIVFVDPPYQSNLLSECFILLEHQDWLHPNALIYFESNKMLDPKILPPTWEIFRENKAGQVYFYLAKKVTVTPDKHTKYQFAIPRPV